MQFGVWTQAVRMNHVLTVSLDPPTGKGIFLGGGHVPPHYKLYGHAMLSCRKEGADPTDMRFGMKSRVSPKTTCSVRVQIPKGNGQFEGLFPY